MERSARVKQEMKYLDGCIASIALRINSLAATTVIFIPAASGRGYCHQAVCWLVGWFVTLVVTSRQ